MAKKKPPVTFDRIEQRSPPGLLATDEDREIWVRRTVAEDEAKLATLCEHFGIEPGPAQWYMLALTLARERYPTPNKKPASKWRDETRMALVVEIERLAVDPDDPAHGAAWAAKILANREPWRSLMTGNKRPDEALRKAYFAYRDDKWARVARDAFKYHEEKDTIAEWDAWVADAVTNPGRQ